MPRVEHASMCCSCGLTLSRAMNTCLRRGSARYEYRAKLCIAGCVSTSSAARKAVAPLQQQSRRLSYCLSSVQLPTASLAACAEQQHSQVQSPPVCASGLSPPRQPSTIRPLQVLTRGSGIRERWILLLPSKVLWRSVRVSCAQRSCRRESLAAAMLSEHNTTCRAGPP